MRKVQAHLQEKRKDEIQKQMGEGKTSHLLMDTKYSFAVKFPFNPSSIHLESIEVPQSFGVGDLLKKL